MSDSPLEELESREHAEHAEHAAHSHNPLITWVSITIAVLAVLSALVGSLETIASGRAIGEKNEAVLAQSQASDQWAFYQAKSLKKHIYTVGAGIGGPNADKFTAIAKTEGAEEDKIQGEAKALEKERDEHLRSSDSAEDQHHKLTIAATLMHMGIAIATIAIITNKKWPFHASVVLGVLGSIVAAVAYL